MKLTRGKEIADMVFESAVTIGIIMFLLILSGCSLAPKVVKENAAKGVTKYCDTFTYEQRVGVLRPEFNALIYPHKVKLTCFGDPDNQEPIDGPE